MSNFQKRELYGGAIVADVPDSFIDASMLREVSDTQELYVNSIEDAPAGCLHKDDSIIFDLLQAVPEQGLEAFKVHLGEISNINGAKEWELRDVKEISNGYMGVGVEPAYKWGKATNDTLVVVMALLRFPQVETDVVITINVPLQHSADERVKVALDHMDRIVSSFKILDFSLFI